MIAMKLATIAVLATVAVAAPTTAAITTTEAKPFTFSQWVDDIINPNVVALTPEEAVEAYYQSLNTTASTSGGAAKVKRFNRTCWTEENRVVRADVDAAVKCVSSLATLETSVKYTYSRAGGDLLLCHDIPGVEISASPSIEGDNHATAHDLAVAGGHIMDACTWGGRTGGAIFEDFQPLTQISLWRKNT